MSIEAQQKEEYCNHLGKNDWKRFERWNGKLNHVEALLGEAGLNIRYYEKRKERYSRLATMAYRNSAKYGYWKVYEIIVELCERLEHYYDQKWVEYNQKGYEYNSIARAALDRLWQLWHETYMEKLNNMTLLEKVKRIFGQKMRHIRKRIFGQKMHPL